MTPSELACELIADVTGILVEHWDTHWAGSDLRRDAEAISRRVADIVLLSGAAREAAYQELRTQLVQQAVAQVRAIRQIVVERTALQRAA